jgi:hypothetical protein
MNDRLKLLLEHLAATLDHRRQTAIEELHRKALRWEPVCRLPLVVTFPLPADTPFQPYSHSQIFDDPEKMLYNELVGAGEASIACRDQIDDDLPLTIRANFGTVVVASLFGGRIEQVGENPPWVRPFQTLAEFRAALERDPLDFSQGWCPKVVERYQFYRAALQDYPEVAGLVRLVLPDLQGPLDTAELLRGSDIYVDLYNDPELIAKALDTIAQAQIGLAKHLSSYITDSVDGFSHQHSAVIGGHILIRNDSTINISPATYRQHVAPHDEKVLHAMGGGGIHTCGKTNHNIDEFFALPSLRCLDLGQPELNDLDTIYAKAKQLKIGMDRVQVTREDLVTGRVMKRFPTGVSLVHAAQSLADARAIMDAYRASGRVDEART